VAGAGLGGVDVSPTTTDDADAAIIVIAPMILVMRVIMQIALYDQNTAE
jgi:hypothetical protein